MRIKYDNSWLRTPGFEGRAGRYKWPKRSVGHGQMDLRELWPAHVWLNMPRVRQGKVHTHVYNAMRVPTQLQRAWRAKLARRRRVAALRARTATLRYLRVQRWAQTGNYSTLPRNWADTEYPRRGVYYDNGIALIDA